MKKLLTLFLSTLMVFTTFGNAVFAEDPDLQDTNLAYEVTEGYEWSVPTKLEFTAENFADVVATDDSGDASKIAISKCTLTADKTLLIEVDADQVFEIAESNGHTLDYSIKANDVSVGAGDVVLSLDSGEECDGVDSEIKGTLTKDANEIAGDYSGTLTFLAEIVRGGKAIKLVADGTTATNVKFSAIPTNKQDALKADLKQAGTSGLTDDQIANALVIDIDADNAGDVVIDVSRVASVGETVLIYHKSSTNGWEKVGEAVIDETGKVACSFTDYSPILVSKKGGSSQEPQGLVPGLYVDGVMYKALTLDDCGTDASKVKALITQTNTEIILPDGVTSIGSNAFFNCTDLTSVTIPSSVTSIGISAFSGCTNLTSVTIPNSVTSIDSAAFFKVPHIYYNGAATGAPWGAVLMNDWYDENFAYADAAKTKITKFIGTATEVEIPNTVTSIGSTVFQNCTNLTSVTIPSSVTSIGGNAFSNIPHIYYDGIATYASFNNYWGAKAMN